MTETSSTSSSSKAAGTNELSQSGLAPTITAAGLAAAMRADLSGAKLTIQTIGLGDGAYSPSADMTALKSPKHSIPIGGSKKAGPTHVHLTAIEDGNEAYWIREIGFFLDDGTLFALWSDPDKPLAYKAPGVDLLLAFDLVLEALPSDLVEVNVTSDLSLLFASEFANLGTAVVGLQRRELETETRLKRLVTEVADLSDAKTELTEILAQQTGSQSTLQDQLFAANARIAALEARHTGTLTWLINLTRIAFELSHRSTLTKDHRLK